LDRLSSQQKVSYFPFGSWESGGKESNSYETSVIEEKINAILVIYF
jgi:hypothetical protein